MRRCAVVVARNQDDPTNHPTQAHWLVIDEINRAEIDKAIGGLYTVLGGDGREPLRLWFEQDPRRQALWMPGRFRIIATMNSVDTSYVYTFSQGLTRRFKYVYVGVPTSDQVPEEIDKALAQAIIWLSATYPAAHGAADDHTVSTRVSSARPQLEALIRRLRYGSGILIGAAIMAALGLQVMFTTGRRRVGRPPYAVSSARIRAAGWLTLATALLLAGADASLAAGMLMFAAVGVMGIAVVVAIRGKRAARREPEEGMSTR